MSITQLRLDTQAKDATLIPSKISTSATDDFSFPRDVSAGRDLKITQGNKLYLNGSTNISQTDGSNVEFVSTSAFSFHINSVYSWQVTDTDASGGVGTAAGDWTMYLPRGTAAQPVVFIGDSAGLFTPDGNALSISTSGTEVARVSSTNAHFIGIDTQIDNNKKVILGNNGNAFLTYNSDIGGIQISSDSGTEHFIASATAFDIYSHTGSDGSGSYNPGIYFRDSGQLLLTNGGPLQGTLDALDNTLTIQWDHGVVAGDHYVASMGRIGYGNNGNAGTLFFGYEADGTNTPNVLLTTGEGSAGVIFKSHVTSPTEMFRVGTTAIKIPDGNKVILGNSDNVWMKSSEPHANSRLLMQSDSSGFLGISAVGEFEIDANTNEDASGTFDPHFRMLSTGQIEFWNTAQGVDTDRHVLVAIDGGVENQFHSIQQFNYAGNINDIYLELGYDADGSVRTGSRIRGANLTIQSLSPLNFIADYHVFTGSVRGDTSVQTIPAYAFSAHPNTGITTDVQTVNSVEFMIDSTSVAVMSATDFSLTNGVTALYTDDIGFGGPDAATVDTGIFGTGYTIVGVTTNGVERARFNTTGIKLIDGTASDPSYSFTSAPTVGMYKDGSGGIHFTPASGNVFIDSNAQLTTGADGGIAITADNGNGSYIEILATAQSPSSAIQLHYLPGGFAAVLENNTLKTKFDNNGVSTVDGSASNPSYSFTSTPTSGMFLQSGIDSFLHLAVDGQDIIYFGKSNPTNVTTELLKGTFTIDELGTANAPALWLGLNATNGGVGLYLPSDNILSVIVNANSPIEVARFTPTGLEMQGASTIDMGGNKITNLAAATANGDATRFEQTVLTDGSHPITGDQSFSSTAKITNLVDPLNAQDGATKAYVDAAIAGLSWKEAAQAASTGSDVTVISAPATLDGYTLVLNDRILLKDQTLAAENGLYQFNGTGNPLTRTTDADSWAEIVGMVIYIEEGTTNSGGKWVNTNIPGGTLGVTAVTFTTFAAASAIDGVGTAGYNSYWTAAHTLAGEQYVAAVRGGLATDASAFTGVVKASGGTFSASTLVNADVDAAAAIAESKLALDFSTSSLNADIGTRVLKAGDTMTGTLNAQNLIPTANGTYDIGQATPNRWRNGYINQLFSQGLNYGGPGSAASPIFNLNGQTTGLYFSGFGNSPLHYTKAGVDQGELATLSTSLSPTLTSAHIFVGNGSNVATDTAMTGDITIDNTGLTTLGAFKVTPGKISNVATDDFTFPRNVTVASQLNLNVGNKISFDNGGQVYLQSNAGDNILIGHSATTGVNVFSLGSFGQIDLITQAQGAGFPKLSMSPDGTRGSVLWTTSGAGSIGSRYMGIQFDDDVTNAFHSIERLARTSIASPYLEFGYDANGSIVTGSRIRGSNLTVESLSPLNLVATRVNAVGADFAVDGGKKVILGNSDNAWFEFNSGGNVIQGQTVAAGHLYLAAAGTMSLYANSAGSFFPAFTLNTDGRASLEVDGNPGPTSYFAINADQGVTVNGFNPTLQLINPTGGIINLGYDSDGSSVTGARITGQNLTVESLSPLNLVGETVQINGKVEIFTSVLPYSTIRSYPDAQTDLNGFFQFGPDDGDNNWISAKNNGGEIEAFAILSYAGSGSFNPRIQFFADGTNGDIRMNSTEGGFRFTTQGDPVLELSSDSRKITAHVPIYAIDGLITTPSYSFVNDIQSGFFLSDSSVGAVGMVSKGVGIGFFDSESITGRVGVDGTFSLSGLDGSVIDLLVNDGRMQVSEDYDVVWPSISVTSTANGGGITAPNSTDLSLVANGVDRARITSTGIVMQGSSTIDMGSNKITSLADPVSPQDAATKVYVDNTAAGLDVKAAVRVATTANLSVTAAGSGVGKTLTATANGAIVIDGVSLVLTDRVLVKNQTTATNNGIYTVTTVGTGGTPYVLTRATDFDGSPSNEVSGGDFVFVEEGTQSATGWTVSWNGNVVVDTDPINWVQFNASVTYMAGTGIKLTGNTFSITTDNSLTTSVSDPTLIVKRDGAGAIGLSGSGIAVNVDDSSIEISSNALQVKAAGITYAMSNVVTRETPSGTVDGSNAVFTLANSAASGSEMIFLNGILQDEGGANDYTISGDTITFTSAPLTGSKIRVTYWKA